ncbi:hypothetical protein CROQUDRAFT_213587 [Cronartium quercuum f. sp. fusiforme G11]|uniref:Uncharacterized protein n=2 Tax=Cronartium quercuum f. sp. fusiforme G11 TaxID=708437 RepID=A0A9P6NQG7_9BASI|nr:hypothetical protein CROQUDRAFT_213587 [Cronartium quercuum f. sp. fusiforme G11]
MLNASNAGEEESIAKGYHSGIRGMLGHRGANGSWTTPNELEEGKLMKEEDEQQQDDDEFQMMAPDYTPSAKPNRSIVHSRATSPNPDPKRNRNSDLVHDSVLGDLSLEGQNLNSNSNGYPARTRTPRLED